MDVLVLMGGPSLEHDVSIVSGSGMIKELSEKYAEVYPIFIDKDGLWNWQSQGLNLENRKKFELSSFLKNADVINQELPGKYDLPGEASSRIALLGLHGGFGEDGKIQAYLELMKIAYTGSGFLGSALAMDKVKTKEIYQIHKIPTAPWSVIHSSDWAAGLKKVEQLFEYPMILKDPAGGSSYHITKAANHEDAIVFLEDICIKIPKILVEKCIVGRESSCGFIENADAVPPTEIRPLNKDAFFDFEAKYQGNSEELTPAPFPEQWTKEIQNYSRQAHEILGLGGYSRTDFITDLHGIHFALETNTLPGFTPSSLLPQQAQCIGWDYSRLLDEIIDLGLQRK